MKSIVRQLLIKLKVDGSKANKDIASIDSGLRSLRNAFIAVTAVYGLFKLAQQGSQMMAFARQTGQAAQGVIALQRSFESMGESAQEATSYIAQLSKEAHLQTVGGNTPLLNALQSWRVDIYDKNGKIREDLDNTLFELGEKVMNDPSFSGNRQLAKAFLMSESVGLSPAQAELATNPEARKNYEVQREDAKIAAATAEKLDVVWRKFTELKNLFADMASGSLAELLDALKPLIPVLVSLIKLFSRLLKSLEPYIKMFGIKLEEIANELGNEINDISIPKESRASLSNVAGKHSQTPFNFYSKGAGRKSRAYTQNYNSPLLNDREDNIANFIMGGEGDYNIARMPGGKIAKNADTYTVQQIMDMQNYGRSGKMYAAGRYQFTKASGWKNVIKAAGIDPNDKFDAATQDKLFRYYINNAGKAAGNLKDYLDGNAPDLDKKARNWLANQWRSVEYGDSGKTYPDKYARQNKASVYWGDFKPGGASNTANVEVNIDARGNTNAQEIADLTSNSIKENLSNWEKSNRFSPAF